MGKAPPDSAQYRDARLGAEAKRDELLTRARAELAAQPLEVRRVFVNRFSTAAAGFTLALGGFFTALVSASPALYDSLSSLLPGRHPAVAASVLGSTLGLTVLVYFIARAWSEEMFTRSMLRTANPTSDTFHDLDRLRHTPTREALRLAYKARKPARVALTIGVGAIAAPLAIAGAAIATRDGWLNPGSIDAMLIPVGPALLQAVFIGCSIAAVVAHYTRVGRASIGLGWAGFIVAASFEGPPEIWGIMLIGVAAGLGVSTLSSARQGAVLAAAAARS